MQYWCLHFVFVPVDGKCLVNILYIYSNKFYGVSKGRRSQFYMLKTSFIGRSLKRKGPDNGLLKESKLVTDAENLCMCCVRLCSINIREKVYC